MGYRIFLGIERELGAVEMAASYYIRHSRALCFVLYILGCFSKTNIAAAFY